LLFLGQTCAFLDELSDKQRCDLRVNEYTALDGQAIIPARASAIEDGALIPSSFSSPPARPGAA